MASFFHVIACWVCTEGRDILALKLIDLYFRINHTQGIVVEEVHSGSSPTFAPDFNNDFLEFELMSYWAEACEGDGIFCM